MVFVGSFHFKVLIKIKGIPFLGTSCPWSLGGAPMTKMQEGCMCMHIWLLLGASPFPSLIPQEKVVVIPELIVSFVVNVEGPATTIQLRTKVMLLK